MDSKIPRVRRRVPKPQGPSGKPAPKPPKRPGYPPPRPGGPPSAPPRRRRRGLISTREQREGSWDA